jgi:hypothetical protein
MDTHGRVVGVLVRVGDADTHRSTRTVTVPPLNGGAACGPARETRPAEQACWILKISCRIEGTNVVCTGPKPAGQTPDPPLVHGEPFRVTATHTIKWMEWDTTTEPYVAVPCKVTSSVSPPAPNCFVYATD